MVRNFCKLVLVAVAAVGSLAVLGGPSLACEPYGYPYYTVPTYVNPVVYSQVRVTRYAAFSPAYPTYATSTRIVRRPFHTRVRVSSYQQAPVVGYAYGPQHL